MATNPSKRQAPKPKRSIIEWLLDSDPSIRWQAMRDLIDAPAEEVATERARFATESAGARLLALQGPTDRGLARRAVGLVRDGVMWRGWDWDGTSRGWDFEGTPFFADEVEPCINGHVAASGAYFGQDVHTDPPIIS
jgi:hypothetical protein